MTKSLLASLFLAFVFVACTPNNITEDASLGKYFNEHQVTGTFGVFDNAKGQFTIYNTARFSDSAYLPASTFKIVNSLIALETRQVVDSSTVIPWDSTLSSRTECNRNMSMRDAFRISCPNW